MTLMTDNARLTVGLIRSTVVEMVLVQVLTLGSSFNSYWDKLLDTD